MRHISTRRRTLALLAAVVAGVTAYRLVPKPLPELTRAELMAEVRAGRVRAIEIEDQQVILGQSSARGKFRSTFNRKTDFALPAELRACGVDVRFSESSLGI
jgi:hypothetical protein